MKPKLDRPLSLTEHLEKSKELLAEGLEDFERADNADRELDVRRGASRASETVFHALVVLVDGLLSEHGTKAETHDDRLEKLEDLGRDDLVIMYERAMNALHISGYYGQRIGRRQRKVLQEVRSAIAHELAALA